MLTNSELERRLDQGLPMTSGGCRSRGQASREAVSARRLRRQRRESASAYRAPVGWSVGLW